jgi:hypothetical protein
MYNYSIKNKNYNKETIDKKTSLNNSETATHGISQSTNRSILFLLSLWHVYGDWEDLQFLGWHMQLFVHFYGLPVKEKLLVTVSIHLMAATCPLSEWQNADITALQHSIKN